jgi:hypothetical protein
MLTAVGQVPFRRSIPPDCSGLVNFIGKQNCGHFVDQRLRSATTLTTALGLPESQVVDRRHFEAFRYVLRGLHETLVGERGYQRRHGTL